jgi:ADP-ribose pyrophosphatase
LTRFQRLGEREVYRGSLISLAIGLFRGPDGHEFERDIVHHPGAVSVVPVVDEGQGALLVRQYRAAIDLELLEIPAGKRDVDGEAPEATAKRELIEEVGMRAGRIEQLAAFYNTPGFCDEYHYVFMALDLEPCANDLQGVEEQHMTVEQVALDDVPRLIASGAIADAKTIIGLTLARDHLSSR